MMTGRGRSPTRSRSIEKGSSTTTAAAAYRTETEICSSAGAERHKAMDVRWCQGHAALVLEALPPRHVEQFQRERGAPVLHRPAAARRGGEAGAQLGGVDDAAPAGAERHGHPGRGGRSYLRHRLRRPVGRIDQS